MRVNVEIRDSLMKKAMKAAGRHSGRETVEAALKLMVAVKGQEKIRKYRGKIDWQGDLEAMRRDEGGGAVKSYT